MDEKCIKAPFFTVETVFKDTAEVPVDIEFNLPDYYPEISRILKCRAVPRVSSKATSNRGITVDGGVTVTVIYADGDNMINSYEYQYPFSKSFEIGEETDDAFVSVKAKCEYVNCRAVTERKIDIHGAMGICLSVSVRKKREILCGVDDCNIEVRRRTAPVTTPVASAEKYVILEEELEIGNSQPDIKCLIRYDAAAVVTECKLLAGKAVVKGNVAVNLIYRGEEGETQPFDAVIPFSQLIETGNADDSFIPTASAALAYLEVKPKPGSSEPSRAFLLDGKLLISVDVSKNDEIEVISDAYSRKYEAQITGEEICVNKAVCNIDDTFTCKKEIEFSSDGVSRVLDIWCDVKSENAAFSGDCLLISGSVNAGIIAADKTGAPAYFEKSIDYEYSYKLPACGQNLRAEPTVTARGVNYTISSENSMEIRIETAVSAAVYECEKISAVSEVRIDEDKLIADNRRAAMTVYFAEPGENVWDISRRYLADVGNVRRLNGIEQDEITKRQIILVPAN